MKKTAVGWLRHLYDTLPETDGLPDDIWEEALQMEKEQMKESQAPHSAGWEDDEFEWWYKDEYGGQE